MGKGRLCLAVLPSGLAEKYYEDCFTKPSAEIYRLTGSSGTYRKEDVVSYYNRIVNDSERFDFMLMAPDRTFIGESVINELDRKTALLTSVSLSLTRVIWDKDWALGQLKRPETLLLSRLDIAWNWKFSFNPRAKRAYEKAGFRLEGIKRDSQKTADGYTDTLIMSILEEEWKALKTS